MTIEIGDTVRYRTSDLYEVQAQVVRIDKERGLLLVEWADGEMREWIDRTDVYYQRGESVVVDGELVGRVTQVDRDGDVRVKTDQGSDLWYRTRLAKAKV